MKIESSNGMSSEMAISISNHMKDMVSGDVSNEKGLELIKDAIAKGMPQTSSSDPIDILSISKEAYLQANEAQNTSFSMKTSASMQAEKAASQPKGIMAAVAEEAVWAVSPAMQNMKLLKTATEVLDAFSEELEELREEQIEEVAKELAQKLKEESELNKAPESAKDTPSDQQESSNNESSENTQESVESSGDNDSEKTDEPVLTTGGDGGSEPTITTGKGDNAEPVLSTNSSGDKTTTTNDSGDSGEPVKLKVNTRRKPSAPSLDIVV